MIHRPTFITNKIPWNFPNQWALSGHTYRLKFICCRVLIFLQLSFFLLKIKPKSKTCRSNSYLISKVSAQYWSYKWIYLEQIPYSVENSLFWKIKLINNKLLLNFLLFPCEIVDRLQKIILHILHFYCTICLNIAVCFPYWKYWLKC